MTYSLFPELPLPSTLSAMGGARRAACGTADYVQVPMRTGGWGGIQSRAHPVQACELVPQLRRRP